MSNEAITWAWRQETRSSGQRLVLLALADHLSHHDDDRPGWESCWPSVARLSAMTGLGDSTVREHLATLAADELIVKDERRRRKSGTLGTWLYRAFTSADRPAVVKITTAGPPADETADPPADETADPPARKNPQVEPESKNARADDGEQTSRDIAADLCWTMAYLIEETGARRPTVLESWIADMDRLLRLDGRNPEEVANVLRWLYTSNDEIAIFWSPNVRSPSKLRAKWDQIGAQVARRRRQQTAAGGGSTVDRIRNATRGDTR